MTAKKTVRKSVARQRFEEYLAVAEQNRQAAEDNMKTGLWTPGF